MANDRAVGGAILVGSLLGIIIYGGLLWFFWQAVLEITAFLGVALLLGILAWIGYTMATTPPPEPIADIPEISSETKPGQQSQAGKEKK